VYTPTAFAETDTRTLHEFLLRHSFATLVTRGPSGLVASHLPLMLDIGAGPQGALLGHMARANPQWRQVEGEALAVFAGHHAYVSPSWYEEDGTVPTWNYVAVHAYGSFQWVEDENTLLSILRRSVETYEGPRESPWVFNDSAPYVARLLKAIVGFRIEINRLEGKWKLSQNQTDERRRKVMRMLESQADENSQEVARLMAESLGGPEERHPM
jgi:transcriptional regulator